MRLHRNSRVWARKRGLRPGRRLGEFSTIPLVVRLDWCACLSEQLGLHSGVRLVQLDSCGLVLEHHGEKRRGEASEFHLSY